ncbi:MAG TPA: hypothetical protein VHS96_01835 [Bacteroidia bacterium]|nr:hypothetical protein [Bacteroidia bacterium]
MKRFGLPILLSAGYASLLFLVFSSDFSKEHTFLLTKDHSLPNAKALEKPVHNFEASLSNRIAVLRLTHGNLPATPAASSATDQQSPESASEMQH